MAERKRYPYGIEYKTSVEMMANKRGLKSGPMGAVRALLTFLNKETGQAFPNKDTLAARIGGGKRSATRHLNTLEEMGVIEAVAYRNGGHGRSTVWKFTAPAWAKPDQYRDSPNNSANLARKNENNSANLSNNSANLSNNSANLAPQPDKNLIRTGEKGAPKGANVGTGAARPFPAWGGDREEPFTVYLDRKKAHEREALRAAENEGGDKILNGSSREATL